MTPRDLIAALETVAEAPAGVQRLRELVLQFAVEGKLVAQDPRDQSAIALLRRIRAEKATLIKKGVLRQAKPLPCLSDDERPYTEPVGWALVRFGGIFLDLFTGPFGTSLKAAEYVVGGIPVVNPQNIRGGTINPTDDTCVGPATARRLSSFVLRERDVVVARRGEMGRCAVVEAKQDGWLCGTGSLVLRPPSVLAPRFVSLYLRSPWTVARLSGDSVGATMNNLNQRILINLPFGLPPLAEQQRIVARVDELMGLLDRLEAAHTASESTRTAARDAALAALREATDPEEVEVAWNRISGRLHDLCVVPEDVKALRDAVLGLALQGRLVPQDPRDDPVSILIERVAAERRASAVKGSKKETIAALLDGDLPALPSGWRWVVLGQLLLDIEAGWSPAALPRPKEKEEWGVLKVSACSWGKFLHEENKALIPGTKPRPEFELKPGDFIISRANTKELVARSVVVADCPPRLMLCDKTLRLKPAAYVNVHYLNLANHCHVARAHYEANASGTSASMRNVSQEVIRATPIPLPPSAEQRRIVSKVEELMRLVDRLEERLRDTRRTQAAFAAAAVHDLDA